jgi:hypothetical protein
VAEARRLVRCRSTRSWPGSGRALLEIHVGRRTFRA